MRGSLGLYEGSLSSHEGSSICEAAAVCEAATACEVAAVCLYGECVEKVCGESVQG